MKYHAHHDPVRQRVALYCELGPDPERPGARLFAAREHPLYSGGPVVSVAPGDEPPMWDWFPQEAIAPLVEALAPRPAATERHLDDAIAVRDRLLSIVERGAERAFTPVFVGRID